jgi:hypothetical protein
MDNKSLAQVLIRRHAVCKWPSQHLSVNYEALSPAESNKNISEMTEYFVYLP